MKKNFLSIETSINRIFLVLYIDRKLFSLEKSVNGSIEEKLNDLIKNIFTGNEAAMNKVVIDLIKYDKSIYILDIQVSKLQNGNVFIDGWSYKREADADIPLKTAEEVEVWNRDNKRISYYL